MGLKIAKETILSEISEKLAVVESYQSRETDPTAESRITRMEDDKCSDKVYYVNISLKDTKDATSTSMDERKSNAISRYCVAVF